MFLLASWAVGAIEAFQDFRLGCSNAYKPRQIPMCTVQNPCSVRPGLCSMCPGPVLCAQGYVLRSKRLVLCGQGPVSACLLGTWGGCFKAEGGGRPAHSSGAPVGILGRGTAIRCPAIVDRKLAQTSDPGKQCSEPTGRPSTSQSSAMGSRTIQMVRGRPFTCQWMTRPQTTASPTLSTHTVRAGRVGTPFAISR